MTKRTFSFMLALMLVFMTGAISETLTDGKTVTDKTFTALLDDESAVDVGGNISAEIISCKVIKSAGKASSADAASFRGLNSAVRVYDSATLTVRGCEIEASASNATGVFAYDKGTIYIYDSAVNVFGGGAGGVQVAGGGTLIGENLTVTSASKAAIRSDRGGGTMVLTGGNYTSTGSNGCPAIYSTADITVNDAVCAAENSRAVIIEGKNSVTLNNCVLSGRDMSTKENSVHANVLLYQSASGDASVGTSVFTMNGGGMTSLSGAMFYCTNTKSVINLSGAELTLSDDETLLIVSKGRWGKDGKNGGDCVLNAENQELYGDVIVDEISSLELRLTASSFTGSINQSGDKGEVTVSLNDGSVWNLTADSYISSFDGSLSDVETGEYHLYVNGTKVK